MKRIAPITVILFLFFHAICQNRIEEQIPAHKIITKETGGQPLLNMQKEKALNGNEIEYNTLKKSQLNDEFQLDSIIYYAWDTTVEDWIPNRNCEWWYCGPEKEVYYYDREGNLLFYLCYGWDETTKGWVGIGEKEESNYDAYGNQTLYISYWWDESAGDWVRSSKTAWFYSKKDSEVGIPNQYPEDVIIFPNPTSDLLYLKGLQKQAAGRIYDTSGNMILGIDIGAEESEINVSELPPIVKELILSFPNPSVVTTIMPLHKGHCSFQSQFRIKGLCI